MCIPAGSPSVFFGKKKQAPPINDPLSPIILNHRKHPDDIYYINSCLSREFVSGVITVFSAIHLEIKTYFYDCPTSISLHLRIEIRQGR